MLAIGGPFEISTKRIRHYYYKTIRRILNSPIEERLRGFESVTVFDVGNSERNDIAYAPARHKSCSISIVTYACVVPMKTVGEYTAVCTTSNGSQTDVKSINHNNKFSKRHRRGKKCTKTRPRSPSTRRSRSDVRWTIGLRTCIDFVSRRRHVRRSYENRPTWYCSVKTR